MCKKMLEDAVKDESAENSIRVLDVRASSWERMDNAGSVGF